MKKNIVYAKNPGELAVLENPGTPKKNKRKKHMARKKTTRKKRTTHRRKRRRRNPSIVKTGKNLFITYGLAAAGSIATIRGIQLGLDQIGQNLPSWIKDYTPIGLPLVLSPLIAWKYKGEIGQGIAGGMMLASVNAAINKFIPLPGGSGMSDARQYLGDGSMTVDANGILRDKNGNAIAQAVLSSGQSNSTGQYLGDNDSDTGSQSEHDWEKGELFTA